MLLSHHVCSSYGSVHHAGDFSLLQQKTESSGRLEALMAYCLSIQLAGMLQRIVFACRGQTLCHHVVFIPS